MHEDAETRQKRDEIAEIFMRHFQTYGMKGTIISDVAKEMGISKKTLYRYFKGGKSEALYYFFHRIANLNISIIEPEIRSLSPPKQLFFIIRQIIKQGKPYVLANVVKTEEEYSIENEIVGRAFRDAYGLNHKFLFILHLILTL